MRDFLHKIVVSKEGMFFSAMIVFGLSFVSSENMSLLCMLIASMYWCTGAILGSIKENR